MSRCPNCMNELVHDRCTGCGYPAVEVAVIRGALPPETVLMNRFELGYALGASHQSIAYIAYDRSQGKAVLVLEFFPKQISLRKKLQVSPRSHNEMYMDACRRFLTSEQAMPMRLIHAFADNNTAYRVYQLNGSAANAVDEADQMLDRPILFRDADGKPVMAVNALPIPAMPQTTPWTLSRKLTKERTRKKVNSIAIAAVAAIIAIAGGVVYMEATREYDVTVRIQTEAAIGAEAAMIGDVKLPAATPDAEGVVSHTVQLRKGEYTLSVQNELQMTSAPTKVVVGKDSREFTVAIPTVTPKPYALADFDWAYALREKTVLVRGGAAAESDRPLDESVTLHKVSIAVTAGDRTDEELKLLLVRDGVELELGWTKGNPEISVTDGDYQLVLRAGDWEHTLKTMQVSGDASVQLNMKAYQHYLAYLKELDGPEELYYIGSECSIADFLPTDSEVNAWADMADVDVSIFEAYRQYPVNFELAEGIPERAVVTLKGYEWKKDATATFSAGVTKVEAAITVDGQPLWQGTIDVEPNPNLTVVYMLGEGQAQADLERWESVEGLMEHNGQHYTIAADGTLKHLSAEEWAALQEDMQIYTEQLSFKTHQVTLDIDTNVDQKVIASVEVAGLQLTPSADSGQLTYKIDCLSEGEYEVTVHFDDGQTVTETLEIGSDTTHKLLKDDALEAYQINNDLTKVKIDGVIETSEGSRFLYASGSGELELTPDKLAVYVKRYPKLLQEHDMPLYDVSIGVDERLESTFIDEIRLNGELLGYDQATHQVDVEKLSAGEYEISVDCAGEQFPYLLTVTADGTDGLTLLTEEAEELCKGLRYWGTSKGALELVAGKEAFLLTEETLGTYQEMVGEITITIPEPWRHCTFALCMGKETLPLTLNAAGEATAYVTIGEEYTLCVQGEAGMVEIHTFMPGEKTELSADSLEAPLTNEARRLGVGLGEVVQIAVDERINKDAIATVTFADRSDISLLWKENEDSACLESNEVLDFGTYHIMVVLSDEKNAPPARSYTLTIDENGWVLTTGTDGTGAKVDKLLQDVADEAVSSLRYWGESRETLTLLSGDEWLLTETEINRCKENDVPKVRLYFPEYIPTGEIMTFTLSPVGHASLMIEMQDETYRIRPLVNRFKELYLSEGEYELTVKYKYGSGKFGSLVVGETLSVKPEKANALYIGVREKEENAFEVLDGYGQGLLGIEKKPEPTQTETVTTPTDL